MSDEPIVTIPTARVIVGKRLRMVDPAAVALIAASMAESGQHTAIHVGPADAHGNHPLIAGAHRVAAAREAASLSLPSFARFTWALKKEK